LGEKIRSFISSLILFLLFTGYLTGAVLIMSSLICGRQAPQFNLNADGNLTAAVDDKLRLTIKLFKHNAYLDIREFFEKHGTTIPTKRGVTLTMEEWTAIKSNLAEINSLVVSMDKAIKDSTASLKPVKLRLSERICVSVEVHRTKVFLPIVKVVIEKACSRTDRKTEDQENAKAAALALHLLVWQTLFGLCYTDIDTAFKKFHAEFATERVRIEQQATASEDALFKSFLNLSSLA